MSSEINQEIAEILGIEHIHMQEQEFSGRWNDDPYFGRDAWYTLYDDAEVWGESFPKDWENNLNHAIELFTSTNATFSELHFDLGTAAQYRWTAIINAHHPSQEISAKADKPSKAICLAWITWKEMQE
jgi:hypothetical protein